MEILSLKEWVPVLKRYFEERIRQTTGHALETEGITPDILRKREDADSPKRNLVNIFLQQLIPAHLSKTSSRTFGRIWGWLTVRMVAMVITERSVLMN